MTVSVFVLLSVENDNVHECVFAAIWNTPHCTIYDAQPTISAVGKITIVHHVFDCNVCVCEHINRSIVRYIANTQIKNHQYTTLDAMFDVLTILHVGLCIE